MKMIVGLGNPGQQYERTRHNVGFMVVDRLSARWGAPDSGPWRAKHHAHLLECPRPFGKTILVKPMTYMNRSGQAVAEASAYFKVEPNEDLLVIVDDVALPLGALRLRAKGSPGSHNGLADIGQRLGTTEFARLRFGIDEPGLLSRTNYVLGRFSDEEQDVLSSSLTRAAEAAECWAAEGIETAMNQYNQRPENRRARNRGGSISADDDSNAGGTGSDDGP
ncbi:MAG: aminoacyl-tRNA hydrolase [Planctomycetes bacterium]|nr:aminoacyl-tRNA hydrolase [Planctomycetota bacterium]NOG54560.1 aminoacyl-tRNA hydrolase [Planctomycetota bacterium]